MAFLAISVRFAGCDGAVDQIGAALVFFDVLNEDAARLYRRLGSEHLPGNVPWMLIGMKVLRTAVA